LLGADLCVLRLLAVDGFALRQMMLPILDLFTQNTLPKCWRL
jgi:urease accessory protein